MNYSPLRQLKKYKSILKKYKFFLTLLSIKRPFGLANIILPQIFHSATEGFGQCKECNTCRFVNVLGTNLILLQRTQIDTDFFGNSMESCNIGCYSGKGTDTEYKPEGFLEKIIRIIKNTFEAIIHEIAVIFD